MGERETFDRLIKEQEKVVLNGEKCIIQLYHGDAKVDVSNGLRYKNELAEIIRYKIEITRLTPTELWDKHACKFNISQAKATCSTMIVSDFYPASDIDDNSILNIIKLIASYLGYSNFIFLGRRMDTKIYEMLLPFILKKWINRRTSRELFLSFVEVNTFESYAKEISKPETVEEAIAA